MLIECDPSIKAIVLKIDQDKHDYIIEDLDDQHLVIKESQLPRLKERLEEVDIPAMLPLRVEQTLLMKCSTGSGRYPADARRKRL